MYVYVYVYVYVSILAQIQQREFSFIAGGNAKKVAT